jgi:hypothetical protein
MQSGSSRSQQQQQQAAAGGSSGGSSSGGGRRRRPRSSSGDDFDAAAAGDSEAAAAAAGGSDAADALLPQDSRRRRSSNGSSGRQQRQHWWDVFSGGSGRLLQRCVGQCNVQTDIKEAVFLGQDDVLVACGSDDGYVFIYNSHTGREGGYRIRRIATLAHLGYFPADRLQVLCCKHWPLLHESLTLLLRFFFPAACLPCNQVSPSRS